MRFTLQRDSFLRPLAQVVNVVDRRNTMAVLSNLLVRIHGDKLSMTGTDLEVEMISRVPVEDPQEGEATIPARKLLEIVRALPDGSRITVQQVETKVTIQSGRSRFTLSSLPPQDFPVIGTLDAAEHIVVEEATLKELIEQTAFAMAQHDVRYYLNGLLIDLQHDRLRCVATDGHRLALCQASLNRSSNSSHQLILPRKGVTELARLLDPGDRSVNLELTANHLRFTRDDITFTSKLIDGRFPDYEAVLPIGLDQTIQLNRETLRAALQRVAILTNEKYRGVRLEISPNLVRISGQNPDQEEAQEEIEVQTSIEGLAIGFNVMYLLDALTALRGEDVVLLLRDANSSALVQDHGSESARHVVMPLRL